MDFRLLGPFEVWHDALTTYDDLDLPEAARVRAELAGLVCACVTADGGLA